MTMYAQLNKNRNNVNIDMAMHPDSWDHVHVWIRKRDSVRVTVQTLYTAEHLQELAYFARKYLDYGNCHKGKSCIFSDRK